MFHVSMKKTLLTVLNESSIGDGREVHRELLRDGSANMLIPSTDALTGIFE